MKMKMRNNRKAGPMWVILMCAIVGLAWVSTGYAALDCGTEPCPGTLPSIWSHPSKTVDGEVRVLGWNLSPSTIYGVVLVQPDGTALTVGSVVTDSEGDFLGSNGAGDSQAFLCQVPDLELTGVYQVQLNLNNSSVAATTFYHN